MVQHPSPVTPQRATRAERAIRSPQPSRRIRVMITALASVVAGTLGVVGPTAVPAQAAPPLRYETVVSGLSHPWDVAFIGDLMLFDERSGQVWSKRGSAAAKKVTISGLPSTVRAAGEGGLLGLVVDPGAATNKLFYTCAATTFGDVRVNRWRLTSDTAATSAGSPLVTGLPLTSGRHTGCRLRFGTDGKLYVGTGDAAVGANPQNLDSLGGKVLRVNSTGGAPSDNPYGGSSSNRRFVWTFGHRNVQGLALRPGTSQLWSVEQGSSRDDEVNLISKGANYGWNPVPAGGGAGYNESVPMTDTTKYPNAKVAQWSSGPSTIATSGGTFLQGARWGVYQGWFVVGVLKNQHIRLMRLDLTGKIAATSELPGSDAFGRIRAVQMGPDGNLYFTTDNGTNDKIIRVVPNTPAAPSVPLGSLVQTVGVTAARTGSQVYAFVRSTGGRVYYKRSTDDGRSWGGWTYAGVSSTNAPSVTSSAAGRIDLVTRNADRSVTHTWFVNGARAGSTSIAGIVIAQHVSSPGDKTLDVFAVSPSGAAHRRHYDGTRWGGWVSLGGLFTSSLSASVNVSTKITTVTGRSRGGATYERTVTPTGNGSAWVSKTPAIAGYSARALGDTWSGVGMVAVASGADRNLVVQRGSLVMGVSALYNSDPDVVTRPDGTFMIFGRSTSGGLYLNDARPGGYRNIALGGVVL